MIKIIWLVRDLLQLCVYVGVGSYYTEAWT